MTAVINFFALLYLTCAFISPVFDLIFGPAACDMVSPFGPGHVDPVIHLWSQALGQAMIPEPWKFRVKSAEILFKHLKDCGVAGKPMLWHQTRNKNSTVAQEHCAEKGQRVSGDEMQRVW